MEGAAAQAVAQMTMERAQLMEQLPGLEDWATGNAAQPTPGDRGLANAPVSATPGRLRGAVDAGMAQARPHSPCIIAIANHMEVVC